MNERLKNVETLERERERESYTLKDGTAGITLVALMVTIIVLLILAMVSVSLVLRGNIIEKANLAVTEYQKAAEQENTNLDELESEINKYIPGGSGEVSSKLDIMGEVLALSYNSSFGDAQDTPSEEIMKQMEQLLDKIEMSFEEFSGIIGDLDDIEKTFDNGKLDTDPMEWEYYWVIDIENYGRFLLIGKIKENGEDKHVDYIKQSETKMYAKINGALEVEKELKERFENKGKTISEVQKIIDNEIARLENKEVDESLERLLVNTNITNIVKTYESEDRIDLYINEFQYYQIHDNDRDGIIDEIFLNAN